tara:strand:+ start:112 stop:543 length:432 start_codon:yes stop_codon:yes gene_type:complete
MRNFQFIIFLICINSSFFSQKKYLEYDDAYTILSNNYVSFKAISFDCNGLDNEDVFIEINNKSDSHIAISFVEKLYYDGVCVTCNDSNYVYKMNLAPSEIIRGDCKATFNNGLRLKSKIEKNAVLSNLSGYKIKIIDTLIIDK